MRVLLVSTYPPRRCGIGDYTADLGRALSRTNGVEVSVLTYPDGVAVGGHTAGSPWVDRRLGWARSPRRLTKVIRELEPDIVHVQSSTFLHPIWVNGALAKAEICAPLLTTVHDVPANWRAIYTIPALRALYNRSRKLFAHAEQTALTLKKLHGIPSSRIVRIPHGVDPGTYRPDAETGHIREVLDLADKRIVLFFGFLRPGKGIPILVQAWARVEKEYPETILVIAGGTASRPRRYRLFLSSEANYAGELRHLAQRLGIADRVRFTGYVPDAFVPSLLAASDVVVLPSSAGSQSGPLHKALCSGRPVIVPKTPAVLELLRGVEAALLTQPGSPDALAQAIGRLLDERQLASEIGRRARDLALGELSWERVAGRTIAIYQQCETGGIKDSGRAAGI